MHFENRCRERLMHEHFLEMEKPKQPGFKVPGLEGGLKGNGGGGNNSNVDHSDTILNLRPRSGMSFKCEKVKERGWALHQFYQFNFKKTHIGTKKGMGRVTEIM